MDVSIVTGQLLKSGMPVSNALVYLRGDNYNAYSSARSNNDGHYSVMKKYDHQSTFKL